MTPKRAYETFLAVRTHFTSSSYDYFKYNGKIPVKKPLSDSQSYIFKKLMNRYTPEQYIDFLVCNLLENPKMWFPELMEPECHTRYTEFAKKYESLSYTFEQECATLFEKFGVLESDVSQSFNALFDTQNDLPNLLRGYIMEIISIDTIIFMEKLFNFLSQWKKSIGDTLIFEEFYTKISNYSSFVSPRMDTESGKRILQRLLQT